MALHYIIDGYNLIRGAETLSGGSLRDQRERLLLWVESKRPQGRNEVTVVFDGRADVSGPRWAGPTRVVFSAGQDADKVIKDRVDGMSNPRNAVVVTDDRAIQRWVRGVGARCLGCREFLSSAGPEGRRRGPVPKLDARAMEDINDELRDVWKLK